MTEVQNTRVDCTVLVVGVEVSSQELEELSKAKEQDLDGDFSGNGDQLQG